MRLKVLLILFFILPLISYPQQEIDEEQLQELREMSLEEVLQSEISVTSQIPLSMRESPGIVTLITRDDIINTGARDLIDILTLLVPGFSFQQSQYGPIGLGVRGNWAFDGKVLMMIDGVECNDEAFSAILFGNHFLVENIEKIEIIRGPGSVIYGSNAALGVINIITRGYKQFNGVYAGVNYSQMYDNYSHRNLSIGIAEKIFDVNFSLTGYGGQGILSDRSYVPYIKNIEYITPPKIEMSPLSFNFNLNYKGFDFRGIYDQYSTVFDIPINFRNYLQQLKYDLTLSDKLLITFKLSNKIQFPWKLLSDLPIVLNGQVGEYERYSNDKRVDKNKASVSLLWNITPELHLNSGIEYQNVQAEINDTHPGYYEIPFVDGNERIETSNFSVYSQFMFQNNVLNVTIGARHDHSRDFGNSFIPRLALTKILDPFHIKLMVSKSYRFPGGVYFEMNLRPEKAMNYEVELGYQLKKNHLLMFNLYEIRFTDIISYRTDSIYPVYANLEKLGTRGIEGEYKIVKHKFTFGVNASYYRVIENTVDAYKVKGDNDVLLGFPSLKANAFASIKANYQISINPSVSLFGERYGYISGTITGFDENNVPAIENILKRFAPKVLFNINIKTDDLFLDGLQMDLGIKNIFNSDFEYIQPFPGYVAPVPANNSSLILRLYYEFQF